jgi:hypothetical protein
VQAEQRLVQIRVGRGRAIDVPATESRLAKLASVRSSVDDLLAQGIELVLPAGHTLRWSRTGSSSPTGTPGAGSPSHAINGFPRWSGTSSGCAPARVLHPLASEGNRAINHLFSLMRSVSARLAPAWVTVWDFRPRDARHRPVNVGRQ